MLENLVRILNELLRRPNVEMAVTKGIDFSSEGRVDNFIERITIPEPNSENQLRLANTELNKQIALLEKARKGLAATKIIADEASEFSENVINTIREPLIALDHDLRVVAANRSFYKVFNVKPEETVGRPIYDLGNKQWDIPKLRDLIETIFPKRQPLITMRLNTTLLISAGTSCF